MDEFSDSVAGVLEYPRDYFDPTTGAIPSSPEQAAFLWPYRKRRPRRGVVDNETADGVKMKKEMETVRKSLRSYVNLSYMEGVREQASYHNLFTPDTRQIVVTSRDMKHAITRLECNEQNARLVYEVFHQFHRKRQWLADVVDAWFAKEKMELIAPAVVPVVDTTETTVEQRKRPREHSCDRGGFGTVGRNAKSQVCRGIMDYMFKSTGWAISTKKRPGIHNLYTERRDEGGNIYYIVTKKGVSAY